MRVRVQVFDHDGNGFIDREELKLTMSRLGEQLSDADVNAMLSLADEDGDGRINFRVRYLASATVFSLRPQPPPSACLVPARNRRAERRSDALRSLGLLSVSMSASCSHSPFHDVATGPAI